MFSKKRKRGFGKAGDSGNTEQQRQYKRPVQRARVTIQDTVDVHADQWSRWSFEQTYLTTERPTFQAQHVEEISSEGQIQRINF